MPRVLNQIDIIYNNHGSNLVLDKPVDDPWDFWTFRTRIRAEFEGEKSYKEREVDFSFNARRVTEEWRYDFYISTEQSRTDYDYEGEDSYTDYRKSSYLRGTIVKSLTPHWSTGIRTNASKSTYNNYDLSISFSILSLLSYTFRN